MDPQLKQQADRLDDTYKKNLTATAEQRLQLWLGNSVTIERAQILWRLFSSISSSERYDIAYWRSGPGGRVDPSWPGAIHYTLSQWERRPIDPWTRDSIAIASLYPFLKANMNREDFEVFLNQYPMFEYPTADPTTAVAGRKQITADWSALRLDDL